MIEFAGEFATQLTLSFYFNNNVLGVRKGSALSRGLVDIVCMLPYSRDTREYCKIVGANCYPKWYVDCSGCRVNPNPNPNKRLLGVHIPETSDPARLVPPVATAVTAPSTTCSLNARALGM